MLKEVNTRVDGKDLEETLNSMASEGWLTTIDDGYKLAKHPWETNDKP
jgi:hypothetical protein